MAPLTTKDECFNPIRDRPSAIQAAAPQGVVCTPPLADAHPATLMLILMLLLMVVMM